MESELALLSAFGAIGAAVSVTNMVAARLRLTPIILYLAVGIALGPSVLSIVEPEEMGLSFEVALEVLVALIVFEGALSIDVTYLLRMGRVVRNLITIGLLCTVIAATLLAAGLDLLPWRTALVFGGLVAVTGPTVITPVVRRISLNDRVRAVLMGEGVLIDPIGAVLAVVLLELVLSGLEAEPVLYFPGVLAVGAAMGAAGAIVVAGVLKLNKAPSATDTNLLLLGLSAATFAVSERLLGSSGLAAMVVMGIALSWRSVPHIEDVRGFQDDLTKVLIAGVYILASATVDLAIIRDIWGPGLLLILALMFVVRPLAVWLAAAGSDLQWREKLFVGLVGPRGVVAAALAAFGGQRLGEELDGPRLTALVFLTILLTVTVQTTYAGPLARLLKVESLKAVIAGAGEIARRVAVQLQANGYSVRLLDHRPELVERAKREGLTASEVDVADLDALREVGVADADLVLALTDSDETNLLFSQLARTNGNDDAFAIVSQPDAVEAFRKAGVHVVDRVEAVTDAVLSVVGNPLLFEALSRGEGERVAIEVTIGSGIAGRRIAQLPLPNDVLVILVRRAGKDLVPRGNTALERGDRLLLFGAFDAVTEARAELVAIE